MKISLSILFAWWVIASSWSQETFSLEQAISFALANHSSMYLADMAGEDAFWQYREAKSIGMPQITGNAQYNYYYETPVNPVQDFLTPAIYGVLAQEGLAEPFTGELDFFEFGFIRKNQLTAGLQAEAMVFDGNYLKGLKVARMFIQLNKDRKVLTEQEIRQNVTRAYQNVLISERSLDIIDKNIENIETTLKEAEAIYENGFIEELDVDRLRLSLENLRADRDRSKQLVEVNYNLLKFQMSYSLDDPIKVSDDLEDTVNEILLDPLVIRDDVNFELRPEFNLLKEAIRLDLADLERIKMGYWPTLTASINFDESLQRDKFFNNEEAGFLASGSIGLSARIPIYDGGNIKSKVERKKILLSQREIELNEFKRSMRLQVYNARTNFNNSRLSLLSAEKSLELNEKIYSKTQIKYREGVGSSVEVTQAEASLYQSQGNYINALYDLLVAKTEVDIATGQLLNLGK